MTDLQLLHAELSARLVGRLPLESVRVLEATQAHRNYWKPSEVDVVLLAESHVFTSDSETLTRVNLGSFGETSAPNSFVRLVYCLGYGESALVNGKLSQNAGTWQYWKLLSSCVQHPVSAPPPYKVLKKQAPIETRIQSKLSLLRELRRRGIWLLDASLNALYGGGDKPSLETIRLAIEASWELHIRSVIQTNRPKAIMVVGKTVFNTLGDRLAKSTDAEIACISQPNAFLTREQLQSDLVAIHELCHRYARQ